MGPSDEVARVRDLEARLRTLVEGEPSALTWLVPALRELLEVQHVIAYSLAPRGDGLRVEEWAGEVAGHDLRGAFDEWLRDKLVGWGAYNPIRPEPDQRNAVLTFAQLRKVSGIDGASTPVMRDVVSRTGLANHDRIRVVLCEGASMLAWVGAFQPEPFDRTKIARLEQLVPAMRRRLRIERMLGTADRVRATHDAAFDAIPSPAFLVSADGAVLHANQPGHHLLERDAASVRAMLREAIAAPSESCSVTRIAANGSPEHFLVTLKSGTNGDTEARLGASATKWGLTRRQRDVLQLLVRGMSNRAIAASLGMAEKTVEVHLTAMFEKAQVASRAALVAKVWTG